ncbi:MAG: DUF2914 domain-containing protein [Candidatus Staskawiczbacteria bacterium]|nr:DUF2914 domain-containing protein [Candidatus Staskawiczbacteria bacterium]
MKTFIASNYQRARDFYKRYERFLMPAMLIGGFLVDYITFTSIQISTTFILLLGYWVFAGAVIAFTHVYDAGKLPAWLQFKYVRLFSPLLVQFAFGSLLGSSLIFYWFSGAFSISWPVMLIIALLLIFNDRFRHQFERPLLQISLYFFTTISLFSVLLPFLFNSLSAWLFVAASLASLILFLVDIHLASRFLESMRAQKRKLFISIIVIAGIMNVLYFTNIIPPIPLALREAGMYHSLMVSGGKYVMQSEPEDFFQMLRVAVFGQTVHVAPGERIYLYSAIFAPANLKTTIVHHWQYYDEVQKEWVDAGRPQFNIKGGRQQGYKGYSWQTNLAAGKWRVYVENLRGQILARVRFTAEQVGTPVELQEVIR